MTSPSTGSSWHEQLGPLLGRPAGYVLLTHPWPSSHAPPGPWPSPQAARGQDKAAERLRRGERRQDGSRRRPRRRKAPAVSDRDTIGFTQENVAAQMTELEERMFRLSEALRSLEPENASRLRLALKFSREELILEQMKETQKLLRTPSSARPRPRSASCWRSSNTSAACCWPRTSTSR